jgi:hypothetical protein
MKKKLEFMENECTKRAEETSKQLSGHILTANKIELRRNLLEQEQEYIDL